MLGGTMKHYYEIGTTGCSHKDEITGEICGKKKLHLIHKIPKVKMYKEGDIVGRYYIDKNGSFRKVKHAANQRHDEGTNNSTLQDKSSEMP
jgi:hypothetical protein